MSDSVLDMLSEAMRKAVMDGSIDDNERFKTLMEELHWTRKLSTHKMAKKLNVKYQATLWKIMRRLGVGARNNITAVQLAKTKHHKRDFYGDDDEKLKLWFLVHTDGSVLLDGRQVQVALNTPDPYLAFLFKDLFTRYGHVGVAPHRNSHGQYEWRLWVYLPLKSFAWLLEKEVPASIDEGRLYDALSVAIDAEGSIYAWKLTSGRTTEFSVVLYNEKTYIIKPLQHTLARLGYNPRPGKKPKGMMTHYGALNGDYHYFVICSKAQVKRLLEHIKLTLYHKRLKAYLIKFALSEPSKPVYWEDVGPLYAEINSLYEEMLAESKRLAKALYTKRQGLRGLWKSGCVTWEQYQEERAKLETEAWSALQGLKTRYDKKFSDLGGRIEAHFRARGPRASPQTLIHMKLNFLILRWK